jgi:hypothetical protein
MVLTLLAACSRVDTPAAKRLVIVVLDGAPVSAAFGEASVLPELEALAAQGTLVEGAFNPSVPLTVETHVELASGRRQALGTFGPGDNGAWRSDVPTLFELVSEARGLRREQTVAIGNTILLTEAFASRYPGYGWSFGPDLEVLERGGGMVGDAPLIDEVRERLAAEDVHVLLANVHLVDATAHEGGDYLSALAQLGGPVEDLWAWIEATPPYAGHTDLVVLADHGRHVWGVEDDWQNHGDQCNGCREIPLVLLGPSFGVGQVVTRTVTVSDLAASLAHAMGVTMPYADGAVIPELFRSVVAPLERGELSASNGEHIATQPWTSAQEVRTEVRLDGAIVSAPAALLAEHPVLTDGAMCWRELTPTLDELESRWVGRCALLDPWQELTLPDRAGAAAWAPVLRADATGFWLLDTTNYEGWASAAANRPRLWQWADGWSTDARAGPEVAYPTDLDMVLGVGTARVSFASSADEGDGRDTRQIEVWDVAGAVEQSWTRVAVLPPPASAGRVERATLRKTTGGWELAALVWLLEGGITVVVAEDKGSGFGEWRQVEAGTNVLGHVRPAWGDDGALWWARREAGVIELCRRGTRTACTPVGADALDSFSVVGDSVQMNVATGWTWRSETW